MNTRASRAARIQTRHLRDTPLSSRKINRSRSILPITSTNSSRRLRFSSVSRSGRGVTFFEPEAHPLHHPPQMLRAHPQAGLVLQLCL